MISIRRSFHIYLGLTPAFIFLGLFYIGPAIWGIYTSLTNMALIGKAARHLQFIGFQNYIRLFQDPSFSTSIVNSIWYVVGSAIIGQFLLGLALALLLEYTKSRGIRSGSAVYTTVMLAWLTPTLVIGFEWVAMYDYYYGTLNSFLDLLGIHKIHWLRDFPMLSVIIASVWQGTAFSMLVFISALRTIPLELYEAAKIDGASFWQSIRNITLPLIKNIAIVILLNITMITFGIFLLILTITSGGPGLKTTTLSLYTYQIAFQHYRIGYGCSISMVLLAINLIVGVFYLRALKTSK